MKIPRDLSGHELVAVLCRRWGYQELHQVGSHIILQTPEPTPHRVAVPAHRVLRLGTLNGILRAVANHKGVDRRAIIESL
jgi:predicted RNA binding protein YcfA (HicA-like mRNA interferase family)